MLFPYLWLRSTGFPFDWLDELALPALVDPAKPEYDDWDAFARLAVRRESAAQREHVRGVCVKRCAAFERANVAFKSRASRPFVCHDLRDAESGRR